MGRYDTISLLSDYGHVDESVGVLHSVIRQLAPEVAVVDVTHEVPAHDIRAGGLALARSVQYLAPGVVVAAIDPGAGTVRRAVAVEVGEGESVLLGPDNGVLAPAVAMVGGATRAVELTAEQYHLAAPGPTFSGRDVFAPVAAHLCNGVALDDLGTEIDAAGMMPGTLPITRSEDGALVAEVLWTDGYGNLQLNVDPDEIDDHGDRIQLRFDGRVRTGVRHGTYAEVPTGEVGLVVDSYGLLSIVVDRGSASEELGIATGDEVVLAPLGDDDGGRIAIATPVTLKEKP